MLYVRNAKNNIGLFHIYGQIELGEQYFLEARFLPPPSSQLFKQHSCYAAKIIYADYLYIFLVF